LQIASFVFIFHLIVNLQMNRMARKEKKINHPKIPKNGNAKSRVRLTDSEDEEVETIPPPKRTRTGFKLFAFCMTQH
jgi:hypothetical protein